jgi:hypothetical protein
MRRLILALVTLPACVPFAQMTETKRELPVTKVVLYQNGVGYFERRGKLHGKEVELRVRPDQINDVLKSLSVLDLSGGTPSSASLPVERSGDRLAQELPPQVRNATGMLGLLQVLRGAEVAVDSDEGTLYGRVVGVETTQRRYVNSNGEQVSSEPILTLMSGEDELRTIAVSQVRRLTIGDKTLSVGLTQSLDISKSDGAWKPVSVSVRLAGDESHDLIISYIHEVPVWRPAYRAWVEKDNKGIQLQGWAVVDNVSGEPWNDVNLTLVVGSPLSFRYNLHTPHNVERPDLSSRLPQTADAPPTPDVGYAPEVPMPPPPAPAMAEDDYGVLGLGGSGMGSGGGGGGGMKKMAKSAPAPMAASRMQAMDLESRMRAARSQSANQAARQEEETRRDAMQRSAQALVQGREVGALYAYEATTPISVPDRSAALINIVSRKIDGRDIFLFRDPQSGEAPYRAVMLKNGNESTIEGGPITLYVDDTFAGEGFIGRVAKDETAFVPYAKEGGFALNLDQQARVDELHLAKIIDGRITIQGKRVSTRTVKLESNRDKPSLAYVKLPLTGGMELVDPPKELVRAGGDVYLPVAIGPKAKAEAKLVEATPLEIVEMGLTSQVLDAFRYYLQGTNLVEAVAGPIRELLAAQEERAAIEREQENLSRQQQILAADGQRIQGNLDSLPAGAVAADLRRKLIEQLATTGKKQAEVTKKLVEGQVKLAAIEERVRTLLRGIELK